jgi:hypothetical protein
MIIEATGMDKILNSENVYGEKKCEIHWGMLTFRDLREEKPWAEDVSQVIRAPALQERETWIQTLASPKEKK